MNERDLFAEAAHTEIEMRKSAFIVAVWALLFHAGARAGEVFLCKSYGGGTFWSGVHCSAYNALIERIVSVPDGMPFDQQVQLAEQDRAATAGGGGRNAGAEPPGAMSFAGRADPAVGRDGPRAPDRPDAGLDHGATPQSARPAAAPALLRPLAQTLW